MSKSSQQLSNGERATKSLGESEYDRLFASRRRRTTVAVLSEQPYEHSLESLGRAVASREDGVDDDPEAVERVRITLHHVHLPALAAAGLVEYDHDRQRVRFVDE